MSTSLVPPPLPPQASAPPAATNYTMMPAPSQATFGQAVSSWGKFGAFTVAGVMLLEIIMPYAIKPSTVLGGFQGNMAASEYNVRGPAEAQYRQTLHNEDLRYQQEAARIDNAYGATQGLRQGAVIADIACLAGHFFQERTLAQGCAIGDNFRDQADREMRAVSR